MADAPWRPVASGPDHAAAALAVARERPAGDARLTDRIALCGAACILSPTFDTR